MTKFLKIGIASREEQKARTLAVARGGLRPGRDDPKVWFSSIESLAQVLSTKNKALLETIRRERPRSLAELARLTGRQQSNLSRTLQTMARYGFVTLDKDAKGRLSINAPYDSFHVEYGTVKIAA